MLAAAERKVMRVRILTLNVQNDEGDPRRAELINREIRRLNPDLVALQEVPSQGRRSDLAALLAGTGLSATHQSDAISYPMPFEDRYGGAAVATRWPHRILEVLDQRGSGAPDVPWCTLAAAVEVPEAGQLLFIAATLSWRLDAEAARERQAVALTDLDARHRDKLPTIIAGDLNASPDAACIRYLTGLQSLHGRSVHYHDAWAVANGGDGGHSWTTENDSAASEIEAIVRQPNHWRRLDYVLVGSWHAHPQARAEVRAAQIVLNQPVGGIWPSDHYGLLVETDVTADAS
jgi:endonuclease/exonuclease/phosphatase family metal-dependent hydrolase